MSYTLIRFISFHELIIEKFSSIMFIATTTTISIIRSLAIRSSHVNYLSHSIYYQDTR